MPWLEIELHPLRRAYLWWLGLSPPTLFVSSFVLLIAVGWAGLLAVPGFYTGEVIAPVDALFTIVSAVCVTGLNVVDFSSTFSLWGQAWVLLFIQLGGLGVFSLTTVVIGGLGRRLSLRSEMISQPAVDLARRRTVAALSWVILKFTLSIELVGALLLYVQWMGEEGPVLAAWHAVFHAVSAFCNAGFSTFPDNLARFAARPFVLLPLTFLVIIGGLGYLSLEEAIRWWRAPRNRDGGRRVVRLSSHTAAALVVTALLLVLGTLLFAIFEWSRTFANMSVGDRLVNAWVMSTMARTAGFNAVDYQGISNASGFLSVLLMFVGGSPNSTAGGVKTTALAVLAALAWSRVRGRRHVAIHGRSVPELTIERTVSLTLMAAMSLIVAIFLLGVSEGYGGGAGAERAAFLPQVFEAASALGTVGLSMGLTPELSAFGKLVLIGLMFLGRVGPLSFFAAVALKGSQFPRGYRLAQEDVIVG